MTAGTLSRSGRMITELWDSAPWSYFVAGERPSYLQHAILAGSPKAVAVRLKMRGEIRLKRWRSFQAEEVLHRSRGFIWKASVSGALSGHDALLDGKASLRWKMLGLIPVMRASGPDVTRSAIGRWLAESIWLPTMMRPDDGAIWDGRAVTLHRFGERARLELGLESGGELRDFRMMRWGNPDGGAYRYHPFGGVVEEERRFEGFVIPSRIRVGWHYGTPEWTDGEFFRATVLEAKFR